jgi:hypothetical protein
MKVVVRIQTKRRPNSGEVLGYRFQACVPNRAGRKSKAHFNGLGEVTSFTMTDEEVPAFRGTYMVNESSDHPYINEGDFKRFVEGLKWDGYTKLEFYGDDWDDVPFDLRMYGGPLTEWAASNMIPSIIPTNDGIIEDVPF